jgi:hypothetical protein
MANQGAIGPGSFSGPQSQNLFGGTNPSQTTGGDLLNQLMAGIGPQLAAGDINQNLLQQQLGMVGPQVQAQQAYQGAMAGYQGQNLQLSEQGLGISQLANQQQQQQAATQQGFEQQQYGLQAGQYPEQQAEAALAYQNALQQTQGSQAISGTQNTVGGKQQVSTLGQQYGFQQEDIARAQALSQLGQQSEVSGYGYSQEQLQNAQKQLALSAQSNGISEQQLMTMLNFGQQQAGVGGAQNIIQLLSQVGQGDLSQIGQAGQALSQIGFSSGVNTIAGLG